MITAIVKWRATDDQSRDDILGKFRNSVSVYKGLDHLIRKYIVFSRDQDALWGMGIYLWDDEKAAEAFYEMARPIIAEETGNEPEVTFYDTPIIVDNLTGQTEIYD